MENNKQTAVEWLVQELKKSTNYRGLQNIGITHQELFEQAKEIEKQQKMECWETAHQAGRFEGKGIAEENWQTFEQYYKEEYGKL